MAVECGVISVLFLLISTIFFRRKHTEWALAVLPLTIVPLTEFVIVLVIENILHRDIDVFGGILALVIAVVVSAIWIVVAAAKLKSKKTAATYVTITNLFNVALSAILINSLINSMIL